MPLASRRKFLIMAGTSALLAACAKSTVVVTSGVDALVTRSPPAMGIDALLDDTQHRTFNFFWQTTDAKRGLAPDLAPEPAPASIAAMGFALTALPIGSEHGWVTRAEAAERAATTLQFLWDAPQGEGPRGFTGYKGFFYHFLEMDSGTRFRDSELSTVDTALLLMGVRCCAQYFNGSAPDEVRIRKLSEALCERVDWNWAQVRGQGICMGWRPETSFLKSDWIGYNEAMMVYLLALGSSSHPVTPEAWSVWTSGYKDSWGTLEGIEHLTFGALFAHQFTQVWLDLKGPSDAYMRARGTDYFENSRKATLTQHAYAIRNPLHWKGYGANVWGLSASDGPAERQLNYGGVTRQFHTYAARGVSLINNYDDGTLTPTAALGSLPFAPELVLPAVAEMYRRYGSVIYGEYGFLDSFNPSFNYSVPLQSGRRVGELGWVDTRYYGINQGPIVAMIENYRTGLIWRLMRSDPVMVRGLQRAGFTGGWLG